MFIVAIIFIILAALAWGISRLVDNTDDTGKENRMAANVIAGIVSFLAILFLLISSIAIVSTKNVGIETAFGKTSGHLSNGIHLKAPWDNVTEMDAAIQTDNHTGTDCLDVRIANQQTACVDISIRWRIRPDAADSLFQNYRTFQNVQDSLVTRELTEAVNNQLSEYNPLNTLSGLDTPEPTAAPSNGNNPTFTQIAAKVTAQMKHEIGSQIEVLNTIIPIMHFDTATQKRLNQIQQQIALTAVADASLKTNEAQSLANAALSQSVNTSPNVLVSQCLTILQEMVKNGQAVPAGFSCWPGGSGTPVIADSTTR